MYEIYGAPNCTYCEKAKWLMEHNGVEYNYIDVSRLGEQKAFFTKFPNVRTVPQIIYDGSDRGYPVHIGGYDQLVEWFENHNKERTKLKYTQGLDIGPKT